MKFKIDDKVRIIDNYIFNPRYHIGDIGKVNGISQDGWLSLTMTDGEIQEVSADKLQSVEIINEQTEMNIPDAVNYCLNHKAVIHTPSIDILYSLMKYLDKSVLTWRGGAKASSFNCYSRHKENTCIRMHKLSYMIDYSCINYFKDRDYDIIELTSVSIDGISYSYKNIAISKLNPYFLLPFLLSVTLISGTGVLLLLIALLQ